MKELIEKYAPLHELKMQSKIEGIDIGLEQVALEHKRIHNEEQARLREIAIKERHEKQQLEEEKTSKEKQQKR